MLKTPKFLLAAAAALGLAGAPTVTLGNQSRTQQGPEDPAGKTDARSTRYYVPKGMRSKSARLSRYLRALFGASRFPNRFLHRSVAKAAMRGRGRANPLEGTRVYMLTYLAPDGMLAQRRTTRRAAENAARVRSVGELARARALAARVIASAAIEGES